MSLLLRRGWHTSTSLLPSAMALLVLRILVGIFFHLIATSLVFIARVNEVPLLVLLPQIVVAHLWLLVLVPISFLRRSGDLLARRDGAGERCSCCQTLGSVVAGAGSDAKRFRQSYTW